jgi:hypothetical protein
MSQKIYTKQFGDIEFERTFVEGTLHLGKLVGGGYLHITGQPIDSEKELRGAIPRGPELDAALDWYRHKDDKPAVEAPRNVVIKPDGSYAFDDGSPIKTITELVQSIAPGPALDAAVMWFMEKQQAAKKHVADVKASGKKPQGMLEPKQPPARKPVQPVQKPPAKPLPKPVTAAPAKPAESMAITE